ncbi:MAG: hypothetical protein LBC37_05490 [Zoogloeaceae bacterium]|jgi:hypothetical protein|nr:hypothetical protein [Zoogloeaceae bacterium]
MLLAAIGVALEFLAALGFSDRLMSEMHMPVLVSIIWLSWAIAALGLVVNATGAKKPGAIMVIAGSVLFVPLGLVAIFGARKMMAMDQLKGDLDARRQLAATDGDSPPPSA